MVAAPDIYYAWAVDDDGKLYRWEGLRRAQAVWRDAWLTRQSRALRLKRWGWSLDD